MGKTIKKAANGFALNSFAFQYVAKILSHKILYKQSKFLAHEI